MSRFWTKLYFALLRHNFPHMWYFVLFDDHHINYYKKYHGNKPEDGLVWRLKYEFTVVVPWAQRIHTNVEIAVGSQLTTLVAQLALSPSVS